MKKNVKVLFTLFVTVMTVGCQNVQPTETKESVAVVEESEEVEMSTDASSLEETIEVTLGIWPEETLTSDIEKHEGFVAALQEKNPDVTYIPSYYPYSPYTFGEMVENGTVPTIFETWFTETRMLIDNGAVADITDELAARGWLDQMNPAIKELLSDNNGRVYGIPSNGYALGLMLNVELFEEAGLVDENGYPLYPKTWEELAQTAKTIKDKTGAAGLCLLAKDYSGGWHFSNIAWAFGATLYTENEDGTFTANLNSAEAIAAMEYVKSLKWEYDVLTENPMNEDWSTGFTQLGTGQAAMYIGANDAVSQPTQVNGLALEKLAMCPIPEGPGGQYSLFGGTPYMFSKDATSEEISAALDYLEVMGKAPNASDDVIANIKADAENGVAEGIPVIRRFPCWTSKDLLDAEAKVIEECGNVDLGLYQPYFDKISTSGLRTEESISPATLYEELTNVLQEVLTNENADVAALLEQANTNYQNMIELDAKTE